jgi:hypothetical protein
VTGDPLATVWQALDAAGCEPHGPEHDFRARCPAHDGESRDSLHVVEGVDRRAVLHCFRPCKPEAVLDALGLTWRDLFPAGHRQARRVRIEPQDLRGSAAKLANTLAALDACGRRWVAMVSTDCPYCASPGAWLRIGSGSSAYADCPDGCGSTEFVGALAAEATIARSRR